MYRLMIIDDDTAIREHIKEIIPWERMGLELAAEASEGEEAMALFMQYDPHIVLTDINIPLIDGMELARRVKETFGLPFVTVYGEGLWEKELVVRAAVCPGSGGSTIQAALEKGAQALVTGDIGHHAGIDAAAQGLMIIDAGHYGLEHIFMDYMEGYLRQRLGDQIQILKMPVHFPAAVV
mgnify:CR=1 FL=1